MIAAFGWYWVAVFAQAIQSVVHMLTPAVPSLVGALVGGSFTLTAALLTTRATARRALEAQKTQWEREDEASRERLAQQEEQHRRELLTHAVGILLDTLWTKERRLMNALAVARTNLKPSPAEPDDEALQLLAALDLETHADLLQALPYVHDRELAQRLESAHAVINGAYNLRASGPRDVSSKEYSRAMLEAQQYFKWLRWNLTCALRGDPLPPAVTAPDVGRPADAPEWPTPEGMPKHA